MQSPSTPSPARTESFVTRLVDKRDLSPWVRHFVFERTDGHAASFAPGQWYNLFLEVDGVELRRSYSIASAPDGTPRFELAITRVPGGPVSEHLHSLALGAELRAVGPHGFFLRAADDPTPSLFVGTGAGIAPLRSMIEAALEAGSTAPMSLLFGFRNEDDILYREEIEDWAKRHDNVSVRITLSRPPPSWTGLTGYVQAHLVEAWSGLGAPHGNVYICGLDKMVHDVKAHCRGELSIGRKQVHQERFD